MKEQEKLIKLFERWAGEKIKNISPLPLSGSSRKYFRMSSQSHTAVGAMNPDLKENKSFIYLSEYFKKKRLNVPKIYLKDLDNGIYILEDLGNDTLFSLLAEKRAQNNIPDEIIEYYKRAIENLVQFQITASKDLNFSKCYPRSSFDKQSITWDLNYFKYYFLKLAKIEFDEQLLENDFNALAGFLLKADSKYFLYRDMNSRNIMIKDNDVYFIDYQGGRKGALQYDIASLLYDSKANLPQSLRDELLVHYIHSVSAIKKTDVKKFSDFYYGFVLIRIFQVLGAYGYRGYFERKDHFLRSIPYAVRNLEWLIRDKKLKFKTPYLFEIINKIIASEELRKYEWDESPANKLTVRINSFSYKDKIPEDLSGNGGGFVFDCRGIINPGRYDEYKFYTGLDKNVQEFLSKEPTAVSFLTNSFNLVDRTIETFVTRNWNHLMVNYGCTGGQHRSVYSAEKLAEHLSKRPDVIVELCHIRLNIKKSFNK